MINIYSLFLILLIHFFADFTLQTDDQSRLKSTSPLFLTYHVITYSLTWLVVVTIMYESLYLGLIFSIVTFIFHWVTEYVTSKMVKHFFENEDYHTGFIVIGADQFLHYTQLILLYLFLLNN